MKIARRYADRISQHQPTDSAVPTQTPETPLQGILGPQRHCNSQEHRKYQGQTQQLKELHITPTYCLQLISVVQQEFFCASVGLSHQHFCFLEDNKKRDLYCKWTNKEERPSHSSTSPSPIVCPQFYNYAPPSAPSPSCSSLYKALLPLSKSHICTSHLPEALQSLVNKRTRTAVFTLQCTEQTVFHNHSLQLQAAQCCWAGLTAVCDFALNASLNSPCTHNSTRLS